MMCLRGPSILAAVAFFAITSTPVIAEQPKLAAAKPSAELIQMVDQYFAQAKTQEIIHLWAKSIFAENAMDNCVCASDPKLLAKLKSAWVKAVAREVEVNRMVDGLQAKWVKKFTTKQLRKMITIRKSPLGLKLTEAETAPRPRTNDAAYQAQKLLEAYQTLESAPARKKLMQRFVAATGGIEMQIEFLLSVSRATIGGMQAVTPQNRPRLTSMQIDEFIGAQRAQLNKVFGPTVLPSYQLVYEKLSNKELIRFTDILEKPDAQEIQVKMNQAFMELLNETAANVGARFGKLLQSQDS